MQRGAGVSSEGCTRERQISSSLVKLLVGCRFPTGWAEGLSFSLALGLQPPSVLYLVGSSGEQVTTWQLASLRASESERGCVG